MVVFDTFLHSSGVHSGSYRLVSGGEAAEGCSWPLLHFL